MKDRSVSCSVCGIVYVPKNRQSKKAKKHFCPICRGMQVVSCATCGEQYKERNYNIRSRRTLCCSVRCKAIAQRKDWEDLSRSMLRQRYVKEFGASAMVCSRCGHDRAFNIIVHHKDYVSNGGKNGSSNLEPLCLNCHGIEHYERGIDDGEESIQMRLIKAQKLLDVSKKAMGSN